MKLGLSPLRRLSAALLVACSSSSSAPPGEPAEVPGPPTEEAPRPLPSLTVERSTTAIEPGRDHHTTAVLETSSGPWLYVIGGTDGWSTLHNDVQRARIGLDGKLGVFENAGATLSVTSRR